MNVSVIPGANTFQTILTYHACVINSLYPLLSQQNISLADDSKIRQYLNLYYGALYLVIPTEITLHLLCSMQCMATDLRSNICAILYNKIKNFVTYFLDNVLTE